MRLILCVTEIDPSEFETFDLLIIGSPTHAGKPTRAIQAFLKEIPPSAFKNANMAVFDTRLSMKLVCIFGYAAGKIASSLKRNGWTIIVFPEGFFVKSKNGPLASGELVHAVDWSKKLLRVISL